MKHPDLYRKACSESMRLSGEKLEEMIFMTENKKRGLRRPVQFGLIAAALAAVLCVTAAAANPEAVRELWKNIAMSVMVLQDDGDTMVIQTDVPEITVDDVDGRTILTVNGESADITDALARDGKYVGKWADESGTGTITVRPDKTWEMDVTLANGAHVCVNSEESYVSYSIDSDGEDGEVEMYRFTDDDTVTDAIYLPTEE